MAENTKNWFELATNRQRWLENHKNGGMSLTGYKDNSKDKNRDYNIIPSSNITMENVPHQVYGIDNKGNEQMMQPGANYTFPGSQVLEIPMKKNGGWLDKYQMGGISQANIPNKPEYEQYSNNMFNPGLGLGLFYNQPDASPIQYQQPVQRQYGPINGATSQGFRAQSQSVNMNPSDYSIDSVRKEEGLYQQGGAPQDQNQQQDSLGWLDQSVPPPQLEQRQRQYKGRVQKKVDRSIYEPHPKLVKQDFGGQVKNDWLNDYK